MDLTIITRRGARQFAEAVAVRSTTTPRPTSSIYERSCRLANALCDLGVQPGERGRGRSAITASRPSSRWQGSRLGGYVRTARTRTTPRIQPLLLNLVERGPDRQAKHYDAIDRSWPTPPASATSWCSAQTRPRAHSITRRRLQRPPASTATSCWESTTRTLSVLGGHDGQAQGHSAHRRRLARGGHRMTLAMPRWTTPTAIPPPVRYRTPRCCRCSARSRAAHDRVHARVSARDLPGAGRAAPLHHHDVVPTMIQMIVNDPAAAAPTSRACAPFSTAAGADQLAHAAGRPRPVGRRMYQMYGQSEAVPLTVLAPADHIGERLRSAAARRQRPDPHRRQNAARMSPRAKSARSPRATRGDGGDLARPTGQPQNASSPTQRPDPANGYPR